jgi:hypothetical protein
MQTFGLYLDFLLRYSPKICNKIIFPVERNVIRAFWKKSYLCRRMYYHKQSKTK